MSSFEDRKKSFENKFARDEEVRFKIFARRNKLLGEWAATKLNIEDKQKYIVDVIKSDFVEAGDDDVFRKVKADFDNKNISNDQEIRNKMDELLEVVKKDFL